MSVQHVLRPLAEFNRSTAGPVAPPERPLREAERDAPAPVPAFAKGLRLDFQAVTASRTLPWNSDVLEGHVNRVKTIKRAICGRRRPRRPPT
ncbi:hypothetical protein GCM10009864_74430 [Streptomyces lunalinharesii]|uniref:Transposase n=1 Tax=Streptomyces lunalinharesii TaxID=333384 RepID=A0ABP6FIX3_9ACTN